MSHTPLDRNVAIDVWIAGYIHLRTPIDGAWLGEYDSLPYARYPLSLRPVQAEFFVRDPSPPYDIARAQASDVGAHWITVFERDTTSSTDAVLRTATPWMWLSF